MKPCSSASCPYCDVTNDKMRGLNAVQALSKHYKLNINQLPSHLLSKVKELQVDEATQKFYDSCMYESTITSWIASGLRYFYSVTDTNAILNRGQMFVLSEAQAKSLIEPHLNFKKELRLLDVGAGDGNVTKSFSPFFKTIVTTEVSSYMAKRLREKGYLVAETPFISSDSHEYFQDSNEQKFDCITMMNLLDRCDHPMSMLQDAKRRLNTSSDSGSCIVIALVLPFSDFVEDGVKRRKPHGPLPMMGARCKDNASFEQSLSHFLVNCVAPLGLQVQQISKVPYLCRGDDKNPYYVLNDVILVLTPSEKSEQDAAIEGALKLPGIKEKVSTLGTSEFPSPTEIPLRRKDDSHNR
jgi:ubiquinone/menaquinone biosynthesis C-methylase UbiE